MADERLDEKMLTKHCPHTTESSRCGTWCPLCVFNEAETEGLNYFTIYCGCTPITIGANE